MAFQLERKRDINGMSTQKRVHEAVGRVVGASQLFEYLFVMAGRLALEQPDATCFDDLEPNRMARSFKVAVANLVKELLAKEAISRAFGKRILDWVDRRHTIIHRKLVNDGWPEHHQADKLNEFIKYCKTTETEAYELCFDFCSILILWIEKFKPSDEVEVFHSLLLKLRTSFNKYR